MKSILLFFTLLFSLSAFAQAEQDSLPPIATRTLGKLAVRSICCISITDCFSFRSSKQDHTLAPNGSRVRGNRYQQLVETEQINIRSGLRGQYSHYYINGIRVQQDYTPGSIIEEIDVMTGGTPAFDEGASLFSSQDPLLIY